MPITRPWQKYRRQAAKRWRKKLRQARGSHKNWMRAATEEGFSFYPRPAHMCIVSFDVCPVCPLRVHQYDSFSTPMKRGPMLSQIGGKGIKD